MGKSTYGEEIGFSVEKELLESCFLEFGHF